MQFILELVPLVFNTYFRAIYWPIFLIVTYLVFLQYRRSAQTEKKLYGLEINDKLKQLVISIGQGMLGGLLASYALVMLGLSLQQIGLVFIWPIAILLLLFNPRYLCFSYAGGIVALLSLFAHHIIIPLYPHLTENIIMESLINIHVPALLVLIGLLHLIEALLIYIGGHLGSYPVYLKKENGKVIGAFILQRFWPMPLVVLMVMIVLQSEIEGISTPGWWPILQSIIKPGEGESLQYLLYPVAAGLGYSDLATSSTPRERSRFSALYLGIYSLLLLIVALMSEFNSLLIIPGVIFAPLGHELLILFSKKREESRPNIYCKPDKGMKIMLVLPATMAAEAELQKDDIVEKVNGETVENLVDFMEKIEQSYFMVLLEGTRSGDPFSVVLKKKVSGKDNKGESFRSHLLARSSYSSLHRCVELGLIPVPEPDSPVYLKVVKPGISKKIRNLSQRIKNAFTKSA